MDFLIEYVCKLYNELTKLFIKVIISLIEKKLWRYENVVNSKGETLLHYLVRYAQNKVAIELMQDLQHNNKQLTYNYPITRYTVFEIAIQYNNKRIIEFVSQNTSFIRGFYDIETLCEKNNDMLAYLLTLIPELILIRRVNSPNMVERLTSMGKIMLLEKIFSKIRRIILQKSISIIINNKEQLNVPLIIEIVKLAIDKNSRTLLTNVLNVIYKHDQPSLKALLISCHHELGNCSFINYTITQKKNKARENIENFLKKCKPQVKMSFLNPRNKKNDINNENKTNLTFS